jgi:hypothetical protein
MRVDFGGGMLVAGDKFLQQLFRLPLQLFEVRMLTHPTGRYVSIHVSSFRLRPVSACSGRKEFIETEIRRKFISGGRSPFRGHGGALKRA